MRPYPALRRFLGLTIVALLLPLAGCEEVATLVRPTPTPTLAAGEQSVPLEVVEGSNGAVLALVPVWIDGQGPYLFALDTGASQTVIDRALVDELALPVGGTTGPLTGVTGTTQAHTVRVASWRLGNVNLAAGEALTMDLPSFTIPQFLRPPQTFRGLLGSDVLSRFGAVTIDYARERLILRSRA